MTYRCDSQELLGRGHTACPGCGETVTLRQTLIGLGEKVVLVIPAGCAAVVDGMFPHSASKVPLLHVPFETTASAAAGVKNGLVARGDTETVVVGYAGDGATFDIGFQPLSSCAERNEDILYICYDNEAYMNTGVQRSSATPLGAWTNTTPADNPKDVSKKDIMGIMAAHRIPYSASASIAYPDDYLRKLKKAREIRGFRFLHVFSPCPTGWKSSPDVTVHLARLAVTSGLFPIYEMAGGRNLEINIEPEFEGLAEYVKYQGRFKHLQASDLEAMEDDVRSHWKDIRRQLS